LFASFGITLAAPLLTLPWSAIETIALLPVLALLIQIGIWGHITIHFLLNRYIRSRDNEEELLAVKSMLPPFRIVAFIFLWTTLFLIALANLKINITAFLTGLGVGGVALALAVQNILGDLFAAFSIVIDKPFVLGDFIIVDDFLGTVENIGLKTTRLRSLSGEQLIFSNSDLLKNRIRNYKRMFERRVVFQFNIPFNMSIQALKQIPGNVQNIIESQDKTRFDRAHFAKFGDSFFIFEVVYYVLSPDYNQYMDIQQQINLSLLENLREKDIELAYSTQNMHMMEKRVALASH
jgi:small-conductance mechanosensitive channel